MIQRNIPGLYEIAHISYGDDRGSFTELYRDEWLHDMGVQYSFLQENLSCSRKGVLRGLHYQKSHSQTKYLSVLSGAILDVVLDLRNDSPTYGTYECIVLSDAERSILIPKGCAHGFLILSQEAIIHYKVDKYYDATDEGGIFWNDPVLSIPWERYLPDGAYILSKKDRELPPFFPNQHYFSGIC